MKAKTTYKKVSSNRKQISQIEIFKKQFTLQSCKENIELMFCGYLRMPESSTGLDSANLYFFTVKLIDAVEQLYTKKTIPTSFTELINVTELEKNLKKLFTVFCSSPEIENLTPKQSAQIFELNRSLIDLLKAVWPLTDTKS